MISYEKKKKYIYLYNRPTLEEKKKSKQRI